MRTNKQIEASRANGALSKGPATPEGKNISSRNSLRHGLFAQTIVLEEEHADRFTELLVDLMEEHQPRTPTETMLVETLAAARWREDRIWGMQKSRSTVTSPPRMTRLSQAPFAPSWLFVVPPKASVPTNFSSATRSPWTARFLELSCASTNSKQKVPLRNEPKAPVVAQPSPERQRVGLAPNEPRAPRPVPG